MGLSYHLNANPNLTSSRKNLKRALDGGESPCMQKWAQASLPVQDPGKEKAEEAPQFKADFS